MISSKWEIATLDNICDIVNGSTPLRSNKDFWEKGNFPWFTIDDIREQGRIINYTNQKVTEKALSKLRVLPKETVLLCCTASVGEYAITNIELTTNQQFNGLVIKDKSKVLPSFLMHYCSDLKSQLLNLSGKTTIDFIAISKLKTLKIPIPPLPVQQQIVEKLDAAFEAIDRAKANLEKNIQNAKELFQSKLNEVFTQKGEGYEECKLQDVLLKTKNINPKDFEEREYKYVDVSAVNRNSLKIEEFIYINAVNAPSRARKQIFENDIIFATVRPTLKRVCVISDEFDNEICSTGYVVLRSNQKIIIPKIIFYFLQTAKFMNSMEKLQKGASYPAVTDGEVKSQIIIFSKSLETQQKIVAQLDQLSSQTEALQLKYTQKLQNLEELRKSILEKAFKGELV